MPGPLVEYRVNIFHSRFHWSSLQPWSSTSIYCVHCQGSVLIKWWMPYLFFSSSGPPGKRKSLYSSPVSRAFRGGSRQVPCIPCLSLQWCCEYYYSPFFQANVHQAVSSSPGAHIKFSIVSQHQDVLKPSTCLNISCSPWLIQNIFICLAMHCVFARVGHTLGVGIYLIKYSRVSHWGVPCDDPKWIECIPCHSTWNTFIVTSSLRVYVRPWSTPGVDVGYLSDRGTFISLGHTWSSYRVSMEHFKYSMLKGWRRRGRCHTWNEEGVNVLKYITCISFPQVQRLCSVCEHEQHASMLFISMNNSVESRWTTLLNLRTTKIMCWGEEVLGI